MLRLFWSHVLAMKSGSSLKKTGSKSISNRSGDPPATYILQACVAKKSTARGVAKNAAPTITSLKGGRFALLVPLTVLQVRCGSLHSSCIERLSAERRAVHFFNASESSIDLKGFLLLPGLINAHDHLEFGLFPRLGKGGYKSFHRVVTRYTSSNSISNCHSSTSASRSPSLVGRHS